jgi:F-type H+-transporting ATPase subunit delta
MKVSKEARKGARILFGSVKTDGVLDESKVRAAVSAVVGKRPPFAAEILGEFRRLVRLEIEKRTAAVQTAADIEPSQRTQFESSLKARFGGDLRVTFSTNPGLIAGTRVSVGSDVYDSNVRERLERLRLALSR